MNVWFASVRWWAVAPWLAVLVLMLGAPARGDAFEPWQAAIEASDAMERSDYPAAHGLIGSLRAMYPDHGATAFALGKWEFHHGNYAVAVTHLDAAVAATPGAEAVQTLRDLVASTERVTRNFATFTTPDGLFEIRFDATRDQVLIPWAAATLEAAYYEIGYDLGYWPEPPIRVEIFPRALTLSEVSSLPAEAIRASGTIALCKYNKLMFTSPRATARGYPWRDTLAHEYVHYAVAHMVRADLPIWLHEALAKYLESRWTGRRQITNSPSRESLLSRRVAADQLITFQQMHPSMAYLPTPEDASTAYAQVFTAMEYIIQRRGLEGMRMLLGRVRDGRTLEQAFEDTLGQNFAAFERTWMAWLRQRPRTQIPGDFHEEIDLLAGPRPEPDGSADPDGATLRDAPPQGQDLLRLGELLRARGAGEAALATYDRAQLLLGTAHPILQGARARILLDLSRASEALAALEDVRRWHPEFYRSHLLAGEALQILGQNQEALAALEVAVGINPFDPDVHLWRSRALEALGRTAEAAQAAADARAVQ